MLVERHEALGAGVVAVNREPAVLRGDPRHHVTRPEHLGARDLQRGAPLGGGRDVVGVVREAPHHA
ncbi:hypothetical protein KPA97_23980, partial [Burkholderia cenocepacia]|nr:hypothetical protein [Burkholderia cenocepacia]